MKPHKHAELIKAWADGAEIQWAGAHYKDGTKRWTTIENPMWDEDAEYRIKPEPRPDIMVEIYLQYYPDSGVEMWKNQNVKNLRLLFDWYTGELKDAVVMKARVKE